MNKTLWNEIEKFDFDFPLSEYSFSTRLAYENEWTTFFTQKAIEEYKKFMYLAATSNQMVSPSEIVDIVWHQHLIFTQSYKEFCDILGKKIEHIPSTHNKEEKDKFIAAKKRTKELYESIFGLQPKEFWEYNTFTEVLEVEKSKIHLSIIISFGILLLFFLILFFRYVLYDFYTLINGSLFLLSYSLLGFILFKILNTYNEISIEKKAKLILSNKIIEKLTASELICLKTNQIKVVIHGYVNNLIVGKKLKINDSKEISKVNSRKELNNIIEKAIVDTFEGQKALKYSQLLSVLISKPVFRTILKATDVIKKELVFSKNNMQLFITNYVFIIFFLAIGVSRLVIGIIREKAVLFLILLMAIVFYISFLFLKKTLYSIVQKTIPKHFKNEIIPNTKTEHTGWEWNYFLNGTALLSAAFIPIANTYTSSNYFSGCGSSCGSGCGSSCGSSCGGGCGGCGD